MVNRLRPGSEVFAQHGVASTSQPLATQVALDILKKGGNAIDAAIAARTYPAGELEKENPIYMTVADQYGNMVSLIQSNYAGMGSGVIPTGLGFMLQNRGALFTLEKGHANQFEPGKRPFHTIIPGFITRDGKPWVSFGVMGGSMQPQGHVQIVVNMIDFDMTLQEAGDVYSSRLYQSRFRSSNLRYHQKQ